jgi:hypothetical protein
MRLQREVEGEGARDQGERKKERKLSLARKESNSAIEKAACRAEKAAEPMNAGISQDREDQAAY